MARKPTGERAPSYWAYDAMAWSRVADACAWVERNGDAADARWAAAVRALLAEAMRRHP